MYNYLNEDWAMDLKKLRDGNFIVLAKSPSVNNLNKIILFKIDSNGGAIWSKYYEGLEEFYLKNIEESSDGYN